MADETVGELVRRLDGLAEVLRAVDDRTRVMERDGTELRVELREHRVQQTARTARRDERCVEHLTLIRTVDGRVGTVEGRVGAVEASQALDAGGRRSWYGIAQTVASVSALGGVVVLLWRG